MRNLFTTNRNSWVIGLILLTIILSAYVVFVPVLPADATSGLIKCGLQNFTSEAEEAFCSICDLIALIQDLLDRAILVFAAPIAALMLGYGGFLLVIAGIKGGDATAYGQGKKVLTNTVIGIIILLASWILIDTLLKSIGAYDYASDKKFGPWNKIECTSPALSFPRHAECVSDTCTMVRGVSSVEGCTMESTRNNCGLGAEHLGCNEETFMCEWIKGPGPNVCVEGEDAKCKAPVVGLLCKDNPQAIQCLDSHIDTCKPATSADCSIVGNWESAINEGISRAGSIGGDIDTYKMVKAIISQESHGNISRPSSAGACGLMQIKPSSGKRFANRCGTTESEASTCAFYTNPANAAKSICIGTLLLGAPEIVGACGRTIRGLAAGFNGGGGGLGACGVSAQCGPSAGVGECKVCAGQTGDTKRWECLWEDPHHITCNVGLPNNYSETRKYVPKVWACYNQF